ncbi:MAG: hypothetical protein J6Z80_02880 [Clostridia bacterium]|nr:hypothetical protein [Clostridia bacterium]
MKFIDGIKYVRLLGRDFLVAGRAAYGKVPDAVLLTGNGAALAEATLRLGDTRLAALETGAADAGEFFAGLSELGYLEENGS